MTELCNQACDFLSFINPTDVIFITGVFFSVMFHFMVEPVRWGVYTRPKNREQALNFFYIFFSTALFSYIMPAKLGIPLRFWLIKRHQKMQTSSVGLFVLIEQIFGLGIWTIASLFLGGNFSISILHQKPNQGQSQILFFLIGGMLVIFIIIFTAGWQKYSNAIKTEKKFVSALSATQIIIIFCLFTIDIASYAVRHFFILKLLDVNLPFSVIVTASVLSVYAGIVSPMPMGLIGYDATIVFMLTQQGVVWQTSILVPVINRTANLLVCILLGIPSAYKLGIGINFLSLIKKQSIKKSKSYKNAP